MICSHGLVKTECNECGGTHPKRKPPHVANDGPSSAAHDVHRSVDADGRCRRDCSTAPSVARAVRPMEAGTVHGGDELAAEQDALAVAQERSHCRACQTMFFLLSPRGAMPTAKTSGAMPTDG